MLLSTQSKGLYQVHPIQLVHVAKHRRKSRHASTSKHDEVPGLMDTMPNCAHCMLQLPQRLLVAIASRCYDVRGLKQSTQRTGAAPCRKRQHQQAQLATAEQGLLPDCVHRSNAASSS
eukprot:TRINITY_DN11544_c0_g2_i7.p1 TRINITY_DN11544_c0_g2~~TRINITY_DN11544_c0_g2_i7.p1  ORF type:complete len:118 (-),score=13.62 TRINITY_DN11544_c0_g2_i7:245-598(-)